MVKDSSLTSIWLVLWSCLLLLAVVPSMAIRSVMERVFPSLSFCWSAWASWGSFSTTLTETIVSGWRASFWASGWSESTPSWSIRLCATDSPLSSFLIRSGFSLRMVFMELKRLSALRPFIHIKRFCHDGSYYNPRIML